jgi:hypothetical protein
MARGIGRLSTAELNSELCRRQRGLARFGRKRTVLLRRLARIDAEITMLGGSVAGDARGPSRNPLSLKGALAKLLAGKSMSVTESAVAVQRAGYRTNSSHFRTQVNLALSSGPFKRVSRGVYTAKPAAK